MCVRGKISVCGCMFIANKLSIRKLFYIFIGTTAQVQVKDFLQSAQGYISHFQILKTLEE